jgi:hypothetical protein
MPFPRLGHDAVTFNDKIYVFGGKMSQPKETTIGVTGIFIVNES